MTQIRVEKKRRVAWVTLGMETGGGQQATIGLIKSVQQLGWETPILSLAEGPLVEECRAQGLNVECLGMAAPEILRGGLARRVVSFLKSARYQKRVAAALVERLAPIRPDAIHMMWSNLMVATGSAAQTLDVPCFWEMAKAVGGRYPLGLNRRVLQWQAKRFGITVLANSNYTARTFGNSPVKPILFYLGGDSERFDPERVTPVTRASLGIPENAVVLGILGRMTEARAQDRVLQAILELGKTETTGPLHLLLVGGPIDTAYVASLRKMAAEAGAADRLHITDLVRDPERYFAAMDVVVSSYIEAESFGLSAVEAMMMGRPALVHACGGPAETVIDGVTGWHIGDASVGMLKSGIRRALDDRARWHEMGAAGRQRALEHFTTESQARRYAVILEDILRQRADRRA